MTLISPIRKCFDCREEKRAYSEQYLANGAYAFYCQECDKKQEEAEAKSRY